MNYAPLQVLSKPLSPDQAIMYEAGKKSVGMGVLLGFIVAGGGQMYAGKIGRGAAIFGGYFVLLLLSLVLVGIPFLIGLLIWSLFDAKKCIEEFNSTHLNRIISGQVYQPEMATVALPTPRPLAPPQQASVPAAPRPQLDGPPPPSSTTELPATTPGGRITLSEDDF